MFDSSAATIANQEPLPLLEQLPLATTRKKKQKNKRRFSDEQIKLLESMFESESKLEQRKKVQLAGEIGLHPRQVAIWFQNRRARWKSKQLERDYTILKANYDALASRFDSLKNEKQSLQTQFQKLSDLLDKPQDHSRCCGSGLAGNSTDGDSDNGDAKCQFEVKPTLFLEKTDQRVALSLDCEHKNIDYFELKETDLINMADPADGSLTSPEKWGSIDSSDLFDQSCSSSQWWEIWS